LEIIQSFVFLLSPGNTFAPYLEAFWFEIGPHDLDDFLFRNSKLFPDSFKGRVITPRQFDDVTGVRVDIFIVLVHLSFRLRLEFRITYAPCAKYPVLRKFMKHIAVIGAGLSGLSFATRLKEQAVIRVFEKSRGIGGRMATRYAGNYEFDHGAQYFTAKGTAFQKFLEPFVDQGLVTDWNPRLVTLSKSEQKPRISSHASYVATPRMNALAKHMAKGLNLVSETHVEKVEGSAGNWTLIDKTGKDYGPYDYVVFAIPSHQALTLVPESFSHMASLHEVKMEGCFSVMLGFDEKLDLGFDGAFVEEGPIGWISANHTKPERPQGTSILVQSRNDWAEAHIEEDRNEIMDILIKEASELVNENLKAAGHQAVHRWLYASTAKPAGEDYLFDEKNNLACIGDWCIKGRVEAAFDSGFALSQKMQETL